MNRKTLGILALSAVLAMSLAAGCTPKNDDNASSGGSSVPSSSAASSEESSSGGESSAPADSQGGMPSTSGGTVFGEPDAKLSTAYDAAKKAMDEYGFIPSPMDDSARLQEIYGISPDLVKSAIVEVPAVSAQAGYFIGIHAAEGKGDDVYKALKTFRDKIAEDSFQYPMNLAKIGAGMVYQSGDYVFYVALGDTQKAMDMDDADQKTYYQTENEKAIDAIKEALK